MRRAVLLCETSVLDAADLPFSSIDLQAPLPEREKGADAPFPLDQLEEWAINRALTRTGGKRMQAAKLLEIDYKRFDRKMKKYGIT